MRKLHNWDIRDKLTVDETLRTIFHPTLALYLTKTKLKSMDKLRIKVEFDEKTDKRYTISNIGFYEDD